jgi:hypothetical protein
MQMTIECTVYRGLDGDLHGRLRSLRLDRSFLRLSSRCTNGLYEILILCLVIEDGRRSRHSRRGTRD